MAATGVGGVTGTDGVGTGALTGGGGGRASSEHDRQHDRDDDPDYQTDRRASLVGGAAAGPLFNEFKLRLI